MIGVLDHLVNPVVRAVLRSPAHRLLSGSVMLLTCTGRRTGRRRTIPVMYARGGGTLLVNVGMAERKRWWRNLRGGAPVEVLVQRRAHRGAAEVITADQARAALGPYLARFPRAARVNDDPESLVMVRIRIETRPKCSPFGSRAPSFPRARPSQAPAPPVPPTQCRAAIGNNEAFGEGGATEDIAWRRSSSSGTTKPGKRGHISEWEH